jgi:hypothetical protein
MSDSARSLKLPARRFSSRSVTSGQFIALTTSRQCASRRSLTVVVRAGCVLLDAGAAGVEVVPGALLELCPPPHPVRKTATASATSIQFRVMQPCPLVWPRIARQGDRQMVSGPGRGGQPRAAHACAVQPPPEKRISRFSRYSRNAGSCPYLTTLALDADAGGGQWQHESRAASSQTGAPSEHATTPGPSLPGVVARTGLL